MPRDQKNREPYPVAATENLDSDGLAAQRFGARLRQIRSMRKLSLAELSKEAHVSVAMLSHIERGHTTPSLHTLRRVGNALGVPLSALFDQMEQNDVAAKTVVTRQAERVRIQFGPPGLEKELLSPIRTSDLELLMLVLAPGATSGAEPWVRNCEKAGMVLSGTFDLTIGPSTFRLAVGDSFQFDARTPHSFANPTSGESRIMWIIRSEEI